MWAMPLAASRWRGREVRPITASQTGVLWRACGAPDASGGRNAANDLPGAPAAGVDVLLNKESKRETPSVVTFTSKQRQMGTDAGGYIPACAASCRHVLWAHQLLQHRAACMSGRLPAPAAVPPQPPPPPLPLLSACPAVGGMSTNPRNTISQLKRLMGKKFSDPSVQQDLKYFPFTVVEGPHGECLFDVSGRPPPPACKVSGPAPAASSSMLMAGSAARHVQLGVPVLAPQQQGADAARSSAACRAVINEGPQRNDHAPCVNRVLPPRHCCCCRCNIWTSRHSSLPSS